MKNVGEMHRKVAAGSKAALGKLHGDKSLVTLVINPLFLWAEEEGAHFGSWRICRVRLDGDREH